MGLKSVLKGLSYNYSTQFAFLILFFRIQKKLNRSKIHFSYLVILSLPNIWTIATINSNEKWADFWGIKLKFPMEKQLLTYLKVPMLLIHDFFTLPMKNTYRFMQTVIARCT